MKPRSAVEAYVHSGSRPSYDSTRPQPVAQEHERVQGDIPFRHEFELGFNKETKESLLLSDNSQRKLRSKGWCISGRSPVATSSGGTK
jgi:hypothetical protein